MTTSSILLCLFCAAQNLNAQSGTGNILHTKYDPTPIPSVKSVPKLSKAEFTEKFKQACFPKDYWNKTMTIEVDQIDIPDQAFYKFAYRVISVKSKDGKLNLLRPVDGGDQQSRWWYFSAGLGQIKLPISLDGVTVKTEAEGKKLSDRDIENLKKKSLGEATLEVSLSRESRLTTFELTTDKPTQKRSGVGAQLNSMKGSTVEIGYQGDKLNRSKVKVYAVDETGKRLQTRAFSQAKDTIGMTFSGKPVKVTVIIQSGQEKTITFPVTIDLNGGETIKLQKTPSNDVRTRYDKFAIEKYQSVTKAELDSLVVEHEQVKRSGSSHLRLFVNYPNVDADINYAWYNEFFGADSPMEVKRMGSAIPSQQFSIEVDRPSEGNDAVDIRRAFGTIEVSAATEVETLSFQKPADGQAIKRKNQQGTEFSITFDKNEVTLPESDDIIQEVFFDASGRSLEHSPKRKGVVYCWGLPERVELTVRGPMISRTWDYDIELGDTDETAYQGFVKRTRSLYEIGLELFELHNIRRTPHNETVAGMRFIYAKGTDQALDLVSEEIALSDPKGAELFQYKVKPHLGYHFMFTDSYMRAGKQLPRIPEKSKKQMMKWSGGEVEVYPRVLSYAKPVAWPADSADPMVHLVNRQVYYKAVDANQEEPVPDAKTLKESWSVGPKLPQLQQ